MTPPSRSDWKRPAIFGLADGCMSLLGVVLYLLGHQNLIFPAALSGGLSASLSMAGGEWMSESDNGFSASCVMGLATGARTVLPALPFAITTGAAAVASSVVLCVCTGLAVAFLRPVTPHRNRTLLVAQTLAILAAIFLVVLLCGLLLPGSAA